MKKTQKAFTMLELTFVIVVIGILASIAIPKFAVTRNDALVSKGKSTLASLRNSIAIERQRRLLRGDFTAISSLSTGGFFSGFNVDRDNVSTRVLEYPPASCSNAGCWSDDGSGGYLFKLPTSSGIVDCTYTLANNRLTTSSATCKQELED